ncbi:MAG: hypothetical protein JKX70_02270 [Phycisphaerales bacterium]|nr:hypothetical protein [Phycisphaerales bacterium]
MFKIHDYCDVLDHEEHNPESQQSELSKSIDELLDEIDASCAPYESVDQAMDQAEADVHDADDSDKSNISDDSASSAGDEALDALDSVSENAEALLEDSIDDLLNELDELETPDQAGDVLDDDPLAGIADDLLDEEIDDGIDEEIEQPVDENTVVQEPADEPEPEANADEIDEIIEIDEDILANISGDEPEAVHPETESIDEVEPETISKPTDESDEVKNEVEKDESEELEAVLDEINDDLMAEVQDSAADKDEAANQEQTETEDTVSDEVLVEEVLEADVPQETEVAEAVEEVEEVVEIEQEETAPAEDAAEQSDQPEAELSLGDLDDALASVGDDLLMGDFETADGELIDSSSLDDAMDPSMLLDQLSLDDLTANPAAEAGGDANIETVSKSDTDQGNDQESAIEKSVQEEPAAQVSSPSPEAAAPQGQAQGQAQGQVRQSSTLPKSTEAPAPKPVHSPDEHAFQETDSGEKAIESIWQSLHHKIIATAKQTLDLTITKGGPTGAKVILLLSKPVASKPAVVRDSIGYIALWTIFLATVLWVYTMFFRTTPTPIPSQAPTRVVMPGDDLEAIENQMANQPVEP